jgi:hypothetical protein
MSQREANQETIEKYVQDWVRLSNNHPEITVGEWLYAFSVQIALIMRVAGFEEEHIGDALGKLSAATEVIFKQAAGSVERASLQ